MESHLYESAKPVIDYNVSIRDKILDICKPLLSNFNITYFEYAQIFNDGRIFYLCTSNNWLQFSLEKKMFDDEEHVRLCSIARNRNYRYALWNTLKLEDTSLLSHYFQHDIWNGLTINETDEESFNAYSFATEKSNTDLNNFFINNLPLFDHFVFYFKNKLGLILDEESKKIIFNATPLQPMATLEGGDKYNSNIDDFLKQTTLQQFEIQVKNKKAYLTKREVQCLHMLSTGKTFKEIGNELEISQRTVESYVNTIKNKTGLFFKNELVSFFEKSPINLYKALYT